MSSLNNIDVPQSGVPGINYRSDTKKWEVKVYKDGTRHHVGCFAQLSDAKKVHKSLQIALEIVPKRKPRGISAARIKAAAIEAQAPIQPVQPVQPVQAAVAVADTAPPIQAPDDVAQLRSLLSHQIWLIARIEQKLEHIEQSQVQLLKLWEN